MKKTIIVTGAAGFIGASVSIKLVKQGYNVVGIDNMNQYYDVSLKKARLKSLNGQNWKFFNQDICDSEGLSKIFATTNPHKIIHLAAQAGVRYSIDNPEEYLKSNLVGFGNILEVARKWKIEHLVYASSSSVYGGNTNTPFTETQGVNHPVSLYAATKKSNELMAHSYSHLYGLPCTGLRFFTVYGPWGRPDMAPMLFAKAILNREPIRVFNNGKMKRDFTYIDDVVEGIARVVKKPAKSNVDFKRSDPDASTSWAPSMIFNIGNSKPVELLRFIDILEQELGIPAVKHFEPMQAGDVEETSADTDALFRWVDYQPTTTIENGIRKFSEWYKKYYFNS
ncbi:NAD dependent epimerase/dehydratase [Synechococcus sp. Minos11]|uniref:GDP-mannose 4,6-dehydratase n=1 Tax=Synechococcus sp. Minos11 TaxID=221341 RepID=UPI00185F4163|nr:GDP-mannose 4,6-dehydratase [Synechococcus sp. Minos11]QNJ07680.1 NAD dependent epimerase/dehydratase [Synechococcus sp. Minos11]